MTIGITKPPGVPIRIGLTEAEYMQLKLHSAKTGVPLSRLIADAVRAVHLGKPSA